MLKKLEKQATQPEVKNCKWRRGTMSNVIQIIPWHFNWKTYKLQKHNMLNHKHNNHLHNTEDGGQAMGEELRHA